ncbi:unnamed protein product, partial [Allacma fusca]
MLSIPGPSTKPINRFREIEPNKFLYGGKYNIDLIDGQYICSRCGYHRKNRRKTCEHIRNIHMRNLSAGLKKRNKLVEIEPDKFLYADEFNVEVCEGKYKCVTCNYTTHGKFTMTRHVRFKHMAAKYMCDVCGKLFSQK